MIIYGKSHHYCRTRHPWSWSVSELIKEKTTKKKTEKKKLQSAALLNTEQLDLLLPTHTQSSGRTSTTKSKSTTLLSWTTTRRRRRRRTQPGRSSNFSRLCHEPRFCSSNLLLRLRSWELPRKEEEKNTSQEEGTELGGSFKDIDRLGRAGYRKTDTVTPFEL